MPTPARALARRSWAARAENLKASAAQGTTAAPPLRPRPRAWPCGTATAKPRQMVSATSCPHASGTLATAAAATAAAATATATRAASPSLEASSPLKATATVPTAAAVAAWAWAAP